MHLRSSLDRLWAGLLLVTLLGSGLGLSACSGGEDGGQAAAPACEIDPDCSPGRHCIEGACIGANVFCGTNLECPSTLVCRNRGCRVHLCEDDSACGEGRLCEGGQCKAPGACVDGAECPSGSCNRITHLCGAVPSEGCGDGGVCPEGQTCTDNACVPDVPDPVGCQTDAECRSGTYCAEDGLCKGGCRIVMGSCGANGVCDQETRMCRPANTCNDDMDCPPQLYCGPDTQCIRGCRPEPDNCGEGRTCDGVTRICNCDGDESCPSSEYCNAGVCTDGCRTTPDTCMNSRVCDAATHLCGSTPCVTDEPCAAGQYCAPDGMCAAGCRVDGVDCVAGAVCSPATHECGPSGLQCMADVSCPLEMYCQAGNCAVGCRIGGCPAGAICELAGRVCGCGSDEACPAQEFCNGGICHGGCRINPDSCPEEQFCDRATRRCGCVTDVGCPGGEYCSNGLCRAGCRVDPNTCPDGVCDPLNHRCTCQSDAGCSPGEFCHDSACLPGCRVEPDDCAPNGVCDAATRNCRCINDEACPLDQFCAPESLCAIGCRVDPNTCGDESDCDAATHRCRCQGDVACPMGQYCGGDGQCLDGCRPNPDDCGPGQRCDDASRTCVCAGDAACAPNEYCGVDSACLPGCRAEPNNCMVGVCSGDSHLCGCGADADCPGDEHCAADGTCRSGCRQDPDNCGNGICDANARECVPPPCARDVDCAANQACTTLAVGGRLELRCVPALAQGREGDLCANGFQCASRLCVSSDLLGDSCFSACVNGADCESGNCTPVTVTANDLDNQRFVFNTCQPQPQICQASAQCMAGQACMALAPAADAPNAPVLACTREQPGLQIGAACQANLDCASRNCLNEDVCWGPCRTANGAGDCAAGQRCYGNVLYFVYDQDTLRESDDVHFGVAGCLPESGSGSVCQNARCPGNEVCRARTNQNFTGLDFECRAPVGAGLGGAGCNNDNQCRSGTCLGGLGICFGVCHPGAPELCAPGAMCQVANFTVWDSGTPANPNDDVVAPVSICL